MIDGVFCELRTNSGNLGSAVIGSARGRRRKGFSSGTYDRRSVAEIDIYRRNRKGAEDVMRAQYCDLSSVGIQLSPIGYGVTSSR